MTGIGQDLRFGWRVVKHVKSNAIVYAGPDRTLGVGAGDVVEPDDGVIAIGSGGNYALAAAKALSDYEPDPEKLARRAMGIAAEVCVFTNDQLTIETVEG